MITALLGALLAVGPCEDPTLTTARAAAAGTEAELAGVLGPIEAKLGAPLLSPSEQSLPLGDRAGRAAARVGTACALLARPAETLHPPAAEVSAVLDRTAFAGARDRHPHALAEAWERLKTWALSLLGDSSARSFAAGVRWAVLGLALALASAALLRAWRRRGERRGADATPTGGPRLEHLAPPADHLARARAHLPGAPREALREGLLALLSSLERRGWGRADRSETNAELVGALSARGATAEEADRLAALLHAYDRRFYSLGPVDTAEAQGFLEQVERWVRAGGGAP